MPVGDSCEEREPESQRNGIELEEEEEEGGGEEAGSMILLLKLSRLER